MPSLPSRPLVRARDNGLQLSYQLPHRVYAAEGYPILAPNGSSIIIYGYEDGLKVIWRGGRPFSTQKGQTSKEKAQEKPTRANDDAIMIIDSDDESMAGTQRDEAPEIDAGHQFEDEEPEVDPAHPYETVLRQIDIPLGSKVIGLAVPRILPDTARSPLDPFPPILNKVIVVSAVCADYSTRVVTLPLVPPRPSDSHLTAWGVQSFSVNGGISHQEVPRGVSITFTYLESEPQQDQEVSRRRTSGKSDAGGPGRWDLLVATHSAESSGLLITHRIPIVEEAADADTAYRLCPEEIESKRCYLPAPAQNIAFNPSSYPAARHSTLLVSFHSGCVKVYSCFSTKPSRAFRRSTSTQNDLETSETEGKWLISLYPGFEQSSPELSRRKVIINADWVLGGRAIMVLMADGEWGVWDLEGAGPGTAKGPLHRQSSVEGVSGGALTTFSVSGRIVSPPPSVSRSDTGASALAQRSRFAPMTPSTKRLREDTLLKGTAVGSSNPSLCGGISVYQTNSPQDALPDESILLRHGKQSAMIPSLLSLWRSAVKASGTLDASNRCRVSPIQDITLMGEPLRGICHLPAASRLSRGADHQAFDILVAAEHRLVILAPKLTEPDAPPISRASLNEPTTVEADQLRLRRGELDVDGMDRLLSGMANASRSLRMGSPIKRARIFS
ncbi:hypothetical protein P175DRAFT_0477798 [Aspergillus ochraceoroseus IBT 24754]|uniref:Nucleoporin NUP37 n=3 Tax=Aspergillus subgen. Nidulantes TaxID=2720870 RepID=A0A0F8VMY6_9EURO|nr:uncharacterized protein P175DRAFT_0477798 [Aspergillus ochraceoroseus IBT 24754]KKK23391.1 hypothetical protein AOCH_005695 [Aspergillus ochraceoroseus]KKK24486.1 hypothetical protein ARAM_006997 [Aspergillus rambellii]PTU21989.1 hypothetical protein P175DRAFT_0477798 [Aspergillus ochraceoroseus IBT 24754]